MRSLIIATLFFLPFTASAALTDSLVAYWKLDETSGTRDDAHSTLDLADNNTVLYGTGIINNAADFEADNSEKLDVTYSSWSGDFTFAGWVKIETIQTNGIIFGQYQASAVNSFQWVIRSNNSGDMFFRWWDASVNDSSRTSVGSSFASAGSYFVAVTVDVSAGGNGVTFYKNGSVLSSSMSTNNATSKSGTNTAKLTMGALTNSGQYWDGLVDEMGFWSRVLTADEIAELYNGGAGLAYPFSAGGGTTPPDDGLIFFMLITPLPDRNRMV